MKRKNKKQPTGRVPRRIKEEAELILHDATYRHTLAGEVTRRYALKIRDSIARGNARLDFDLIVKCLIPGDSETRDPKMGWPTRPIWHRYRHHFASSTARRDFFAAVDTFVRNYHASVLFSHAFANLHGEKAVKPAEIFWDEKLLPLRAIPHVLRQWMRDKTLVREFLVSLFQHFEKMDPLDSPAQRDIAVGMNATEVGFKPSAQTKRLAKQGILKLSQQENQAERDLALERQTATVGRSIRRLRARVDSSTEARRRFFPRPTSR